MRYLSEEAIRWALQTLHMNNKFDSNDSDRKNANQLLVFVYTKLAGISTTNKYFVKKHDGVNREHWINLVATFGPEDHVNFQDQKGFSYFNPMLESPGQGFQPAASCKQMLSSRLQSNLKGGATPIYQKFDADGENHEAYMLKHPGYVDGLKSILSSGREDSPKKINILGLAIWYNRFKPIEDANTSANNLVEDFCRVLNVENIEIDTIFTKSVDEWEELGHDLLSGDRCQSSAVRDLISWDADEDSQNQKTNLEEWVLQNQGSADNQNPIFSDPSYSYRNYFSYTEDNLISKLDFTSLLERRKQIILYGPPGTSKTFLANKYLGDFCDPNNIELHQIHQSTTYEDFIGGYRFDADGNPTFANGILWKKIDQALADDEEEKHILILDEINRGNISKILGECFTALDRGGNYRVKVNKLVGDVVDKKVMTIPENLYIIGTMNTSDLSLTKIDDALRRRFAFVRMLPSSCTLRKLTDDSALENGLITKLFDFVNANIELSLGSDGQKIGHAVFLLDDLFSVDDEKYVWNSWRDLRLFFNYTLHPLIESKTLGKPEIMSKILGKLNNIFDDDTFIEDTMFSVLYDRDEDDEATEED